VSLSLNRRAGVRKCVAVKCMLRLHFLLPVKFHTWASLHPLAIVRCRYNGRVLVDLRETYEVGLASLLGSTHTAHPYWCLARSDSGFPLCLMCAERWADPAGMMCKHPSLETNQPLSEHLIKGFAFDCWLRIEHKQLSSHRVKRGLHLQQTSSER
jgi:hypothetical protein